MHKYITIGLILFCVALLSTTGCSGVSEGKTSQGSPAANIPKVGLQSAAEMAIQKATEENKYLFLVFYKQSDPFISPEFASEHGVELVSLEELLSSSDFVSLHVPLTKDTRGLFSKREFAMMKPSAVFINTARGPIVNEEELIEALQRGKITFATFDVMTQEPPRLDNPLLAMDNVIITPHFAFYSERSVRVLGEKAGKEIVRVFNGYLPESLVNPEVIKLRPDLKTLS